MNEIHILANAKINLGLEVLNKRDNNYHDIESIFQKVSLYDELHIYKINDKNFILDSNVPELNNNDNIIYKAYIELLKKFKFNSGIKVVLDKRIPMQAGLGGGSSDCASFVLGINKLFNLKMEKNEIINLCKKLGADVVPCLYNKVVIASGIGDKITKINTNFNYHILILKPSFSCSTSKMFEMLDKKEHHLNYNKSLNIIKALEKNDIELLANNLYNAFEFVIDVKQIKDDLKKNKAIGASLTGSGSCVFGIFKTKNDALFAYEKLKHKYEAYLCCSCNSLNDNMFL